MSLKNIHINSFILLFLSFILYFQFEYANFYLVYLLFSLFLIITLINIYSLFILINESDKPITFIPVLVLQFVFLGSVEFTIFIMEIFPIDKFFLFSCFVSFLFYFLFYILLKQIKYIKFKKIYLPDFQVLILNNIRMNKLKIEVIKKLNSKGTIYRGLQETIYAGLLGLAIAFVVVIPTIPIFNYKFSLLWISTCVCIAFFMGGFVYACIDKKWYYSQLFFRYLIKFTFISYISLCGGLIISYLLFGFTEEDIFTFTVNWYDILLIICFPLFFPLGGSIKYLLFDRKQR